MAVRNTQVQAPAYTIASWDQWIELAYEQRWTDGLPVYPPTRERVEAALAYLERDPSEEIGEIPPSNAVATVEGVVINSVMAGCKPEYVPVVIAAVEAMLEEPFNLNGVQVTTHLVEPLAIVSGPIVKELGFATQECVFGGGGSRVNAAIGRAVRLVLWNIGEGYPGEPVKKTIGQPGRYCFLLAEDVEHSPWPPLHVDLGIPAHRSAVTMFACEGPHAVISPQRTDYTPTGVLQLIADHMAAPGSNNSTESAGGEILVVFTAAVAEILASASWTRDMTRRFLFERARNPLGKIKPRSPGRFDYADPRSRWATWPTWIDQSNPDTSVPVAWAPESIHIAVSGRYDKGWSAVCPSWGAEGGLAVAKPIVRPGEDRAAVLSEIRPVPRPRFP